MTPHEKLTAGFGLSPTDVAELFPALNTRGVTRIFRMLVADGEVSADEILRVGHTLLYPAWAVRRFILGDLTATRPIGTSGALEESGSAA